MKTNVVHPELSPFYGRAAAEMIPLEVETITRRANSVNLILANHALRMALYSGASEASAHMEVNAENRTDSVELSGEKKFADPVVRRIAELYQEQGLEVDGGDYNESDQLLKGFESFAFIHPAERDDDAEDEIEPTVRVYRGIKSQAINGREKSSASVAAMIMRQKSYLTKHADESSATAAAAKRLSTDMTLEGLKAVVETFDYSSRDGAYLRGQYEAIKQAIETDSGTTVRQELISRHHNAPAGTTSTELSPFVATTTDPVEASRYGDMVVAYEVPVSQIGGVIQDVGNSEVLVNTEIDPRWVVAVGKLRGGSTETDSALRYLDTRLEEADDSSMTNDEKIKVALQENTKEDAALAGEDRLKIQNEKYNRFMGQLGRAIETEDVRWAVEGALKGVDADGYAADIQAVYEVLAGKFKQYGEPIEKYYSRSLEELTEGDVINLADKLEDILYKKVG